MNTPTDQELLRDYAERRSEAAFAELVRRHVDLVYSAALRMVPDSHQARDVTQAVFVAAAQNAGRLAGHPVLSGWLHRTAQNLAANAVRANVRRQAREQEAFAMNELLSAGSNVSWEHIAPHLDAALGELSEPDRDAVMLRYFEKKTATEMAALLGISEEAAQKRVTRAVERLRELFAQRGVTVGAAGLVVIICANAIQAAPAGLAAAISTAALAGAVVSTSTAITVPKTVAIATLQKTFLVAVLVSVAGLAIYFHSSRKNSAGGFPAGKSPGASGSGAQTGLTILKGGSNILNITTNLSEGASLNEAIAHLRKVLHTPPLLIHQMYDYEQITNAIEEFGLYRRTAFNILLENADDPEEFVRAGSITGMGYVGAFLPEASPVLWDRFYPASSRERWLIFKALQNIGFNPSDLPALTGLLTNAAVSDGTILTKLVPEAIANVIIKDPQTSAPSLPALEQLLTDDDTNTQFRAALSLIKSGITNNPQIVTALHALFDRPPDRRSEYYKDLAAQTLGNSGPAAKPLAPDLLKFAASAKEAGVQDAVYAAIARIEPAFASQNQEVADALKEQEENSLWAEKWKSNSYSADDLRAALKIRDQAYIAAKHLAEMGAAAKDAVPDMIHAIWGYDEDARNEMVEDIHKIDPQAVITKINAHDVVTGNLHDYFDQQPATDQNKRLIQDVYTIELFSGWVLPDELTAFTNKLAQQNQGAYELFVKSNKRTE